MNIIEWLKVILLGIVEGITEWLPISSTGHMILVDEFIKLNVTADFKNVFEVVIQLGAILAVVVIYFWDLWPFHGKSKAKSKSYFANPSDNKVFAGIQNFVDNYCYLDKIIMWFKIVVSCLPAAVIGLAFNDWIEAHLMNYVIVALMLIIYGVLFIIIENYNKTRTLSATKIKEITWKNALYIGVFQLLSIVPGTSRSGATIIGGILLGCSRELASEYTFFLAVPVMFGASLLKLVKHGFAFTGVEVAIMIATSTPVKAKPCFTSFKRLAPNITGTARKNVYSDASSLEHPSRIPPMMVAPEREVPGTMERSWKTPIYSAFFQVISLIFVADSVLVLL